MKGKGGLMKKQLSDVSIQSALSIERTILANRRTLLAYIRSAISLIVAGAGLIKFINDTVWVTIGIICIILAPITLICGIFDYFYVKKIINVEKSVLAMADDEEATDDDAT